MFEVRPPQPPVPLSRVLSLSLSLSRLLPSAYLDQNGSNVDKSKVSAHVKKVFSFFFESASLFAKLLEINEITKIKAQTR